MIRSLGIETSCDECSAAVVELENDSKFNVLSLSTYSQIKEHAPFGGVVPEVASRNHLAQIQPVIREALRLAELKAEDIEVISVTNRPGLIGALLVGTTTAKAMAYALKKPLVPVHHLEGHLMSVYLSHANEIQFPCMVLLASGGHTQLHLISGPPETWSKTLLADSLIGKSLDDAAGEAFDKTAKLLGFPYPGGQNLDLASREGNPNAYSFPRALQKKENFDFSFSGLKTAVSLEISKAEMNPTVRANFAASIQEAILDSLITKTIAAANKFAAKSIVVVGGVSANQRFRDRFQIEANCSVVFPDRKFSTDNAAMIAAVGLNRFRRGEALTDFLELNAFATAGF